MKLKGKILLITCVVILILSSVVYANSTFVQQTINVVFNKVNISVNGEKVEADNILYNGTTYVPIRSVAEMLSKEVQWNNETKTVEIIDSNKITAKVSSVTDGDTFRVIINNKEDKVRLIGVDTPESVHPDESKNTEFGKTASNYTKSQLENKDVILELDIQERDKYGRLLAYVYLNDEMFNETLLIEGYARVSTYPPNVKYVDNFTKLEKQARESNKGLWALEENQQTQQNVENNTVEDNIKSSEIQYVGSNESNKYHKVNCRWAKKIKPENLIEFKTKEEAESKGYIPCKVCNP